MSGLAQVTSPPYDVVGAAAAVRLRDSEPHNVAWLTLPEDRSADGYLAAGRRLREWVADGVLVPDSRAGLYVYEERAGRLRDGRAGVQRGLIGAVRLSPPAAGIVLPHESVTPVVVADRLRLMEATEANLEPVFLLYEGGGAGRLVDEVAQTRRPVTEAAVDGVTYRLWAVTDPSEVSAVAAGLRGRHAVIADGHHRYEAYLRLQARRHAQGRGHGPWDYGLALLVDSAAYPPFVEPIHRVLGALPAAAAARAARSAFTVRELPPGTSLGAAIGELGAAGRRPGDDGSGPRAGGAARGAAGHHGRVAFLLAGDHEFYLVTDPDPTRLSATVPAGRSERWKWLDTTVLHELLIKAVWRIHDDAAVRMVHDDAAAARRAALPGGTAVICNPLQVADVLAVAAAGEKLPRKSTSFRPKPRTGLVLRSFAYG